MHIVSRAAGFNSDMAARYNTEPWQRDLSAKVIGFIASKSAAVLPAETTGGGAVRLLDYACGTGVVTTVSFPRTAETYRGAFKATRRAPNTD